MNKIIIAEDNHTTLNMFAGVVESLGIAAIKCTNGRIAFEVLCDNPETVLLITDVLMPVMDGRQLIERVRGESAFAQLPIIAASEATKRPLAIAALLEKGATVFMPKSLSVSEMTVFLEQVMQGR